MFSLWKKITDWAGNGDKDVGVDPDMERKDVKIDNEVGVAVVFEEEEGDAEGYRVREECSGNEDDGNNDDAHETDVDTPVDNSLLIGEETVTAKISLRSSSTIRFTTSSRFSSKSWRCEHMCGDADKRVNVEVAMRKKGVGWVLCELAGGKEDGQLK